MSQNMNQLMQQARQMQDKIKEVQDSLQNDIISGESGGGIVKYSVDGKGTPKSISIDQSVIDPEDGETLEDLILAAIADANKKVGDHVQQKMSSATGGLNLGGGFDGLV